MEDIRIALAGLGRFGARHARVVEQAPGVSLVAVAEPSPSGAQRVRDLVPRATHFSNPIQMLDEVRPDAVLIVSPEDTHAGIAAAAFERGIHVFSEKPLATSVAEARRLIRMASERCLVYQVGFLLRYEPRHALLAERISRGTIGDIATVRAKRNCSRAWFEDYGSRVHPVYETLIHDIDLVLWMTGQRAVSVRAWERRFLERDVPETLIVVLELERGTLAQLESVWLIPEGARSTVDGWGEVGALGGGAIDATFEIIGLDGVASVTTYEDSLAIATRYEATIPDVVMWPEIGGTMVGALREEMWDFYSRVRGDGGRGIASIDDALHGQEIAEAIVTSGAESRTVELRS